MVKKSRSSKRRTKQVKDYEYIIDAYVGSGVADSLSMQELVNYLQRKSRVRIHDANEEYPEIPFKFCGDVEEESLVPPDTLTNSEILLTVQVEPFGIGAFLMLQCKSNFDYHIEMVCSNKIKKSLPAGFSFAESADILIKLLMDFVDTRQDAELTLESLAEVEEVYLKKGFNYYDLKFDVEELIFEDEDLKMHYGRRYSNKINPFGEIIKSLKARRGGEDDQDVKISLDEIEGIAKVEREIRRLRTARRRSSKQY